MAEATFIDDGVNGWDEHLEQTQTGFRGHRHYKVDTRALDEAIAAANLPLLGDPWSDLLPQLEVTGRRPVWKGGVVSQSEGGASVWKIDYATREAQVLDPTGEPWTELDLGSVQVTVYQGVDASGSPSGEAILGGAPKEVGRIAAIVYTYVSKSQAVPLASWVPFVGFVNSQPLVLPRIQKTGFGQTFGVGEVLYLGVQDVRDVGSRLELAHRVQLAPDFLHRESRTDDAGDVRSIREVRIYGEKDLRGVLA